MDSSTLDLKHRVMFPKKNKHKSRSLYPNQKSSIRKSRHHDEKHKKGHSRIDAEDTGDIDFSEINPKLNKYHSNHYRSFSKHLISAVPPQLRENVPTLERLREKIEAIRLMDPYYRSKLTQNQLDQFFKSKEYIDKKHQHGDSEPNSKLSDEGNSETVKVSRSTAQGLPSRRITPTGSDSRGAERSIEERSRSRLEESPKPSYNEVKQVKKSSSKSNKSNKPIKKDDEEQENDEEEDHPSGMSFTQFRSFLMNSACAECGIGKSTVHLCSDFCPCGCRRVPCPSENGGKEEEEPDK